MEVKTSRASRPRPHVSIRFSKNAFDAGQYLHPALRFVDGLAQGSSARHAMRKPGGELLHLAFGSRHLLFDQHFEVSSNHLVAVSFAGLVVTTIYVAPDALVRGGERSSPEICFASWNQSRALLRWAGEGARPYATSAAILLNLPEDPRDSRAPSARS